MEEEPEVIIVEEREEELMVSLNGGEDPIRRKAHFLKPSIDGPVSSNLASLTLLPATSMVDPPSKLPLKVTFNGWRNPQQIWKTWVERLQTKHQSEWRKVGIYDAIMASRYQICKHDGLVLGLAEKWCSETNTFIFPWGEASITLEDVMVLGGFSVLGDPIFSPLRDRESKEIEEKLDERRKELARTKSKKTSHYAWMAHFMENESESEIEHEAFLALWLSRFVFPRTPFDTISNRVFVIAIHLARGTRIALAPAVLASIYRDLTLLNEKIKALFEMENDEDNDDVLAVTLWAPLQLVQVWAWERFVELGPCPNSIGQGDPRLARWDKLKKLKFGNVLESDGECFQWRPYAADVSNWLFPKFYGERAEWVSVDNYLDSELELFARCLRACELVGMDCIEQYLPHRVARQFGMDQDVPGRVMRCKGTPKIAWKSYMKPIKNAKLFVPSRFFEPNVTTQYLEWWKQSLLHCQIATKGAVQGSRKLPQSSNVKREDSIPSVPPGFHHKCNCVEAGDSVEEDMVTVSEWLKSKGKKKEVLKRKDSEFNPLWAGQCPCSSSSSDDNGVGRQTELVRKPVEMRGVVDEDKQTCAELFKFRNCKKRVVSRKSSDVNPSSVADDAVVKKALVSEPVVCVIDKQAEEDVNESRATSLIHDKERVGENELKESSSSELPMSKLETRICKLERVFAELKAAKSSNMLKNKLVRGEKLSSGSTRHATLGKEMLNKKPLEESVPSEASVGAVKGADESTRHTVSKRNHIEEQGSHEKLRNRDGISEIGEQGNHGTIKKPKLEPEDGISEIDKVIAQLKREFGNRLNKQLTNSHGTIKKPKLEPEDGTSEIDKVIVQLKREFGNRLNKQCLC